MGEFLQNPTTNLQYSNPKVVCTFPKLQFTTQGFFYFFSYKERCCVRINQQIKFFCDNILYKNFWRKQYCGAATFLGGSGRIRIRLRLQLRSNWGGSGSRQEKGVPGSSGAAPYTKICHFELLKSYIINTSLFLIIFTFINCS